MSHNLNIEDGHASFAYAEGGDKPWHGLGLAVPGAMTMDQAIELGRLGWKVRKDAMRTVTGLDITEHFATVREDTNAILGVVGKGYTVVQNREAFAFFDYALGEGAAAIDTVGALGKGEVIWAMAKIPEMVEITSGDPIERYLLLTSSHDGSTAIKCLFTPIRVVCNNTLSAAVKGAKQAVSVKHTKNVESSLAVAHRLLADGNKYWERVQGAFKWLAKKDLSVKAVSDFMDKMFPAKIKEKETTVVDPETGETVTTTEEIEVVAKRTEKVRARIMELYEGQAVGSQLAGKSAWGMYNAITQYVDWERKSRTGINNWENSVFGLGAGIRQKAWEYLADDLPDAKDLQTVGVGV